MSTALPFEEASIAAGLGAGPAAAHSSRSSAQGVDAAIVAVAEDQLQGVLADGLGAGQLDGRFNRSFVSQRAGAARAAAAGGAECCGRQVDSAVGPLQLQTLG